MNDIDHLEPVEPNPPAPEELDGEHSIHGAFSAAKGGAVLIDGEPLLDRIQREVLRHRDDFFGVIDIEIVER